MRELRAESNERGVRAPEKRASSPRALLAGLVVSVVGHGTLWLALAGAPAPQRPAATPVFVRVSHAVALPSIVPVPVLVAALPAPAGTADRPRAAAQRAPADEPHAAVVERTRARRRWRTSLPSDGVGSPIAPEATGDAATSAEGDERSAADTASSASSGGPLAGIGQGTGSANPEALPTHRPSVDLGPYAGQVREAILAHRSYPPVAARQGLEGTVVLRVRSRPDGRLAEAPAVLQSSGHPSLDEAALGFVLKAAPLPVAPTGAPAVMEFHVPLRFALDDEG